MFKIKKCARCGKTIGRMSISFECGACGRTICSSCMQKVKYISDEVQAYYGVKNKRPNFSWTKFNNVLCLSCAKQFNITQKSIKYALDTNDDVEVVSINYQGRKKSGRVIEHAITNWYRNLDDCYDELRKLTRVFGGSKVINVSRYRRTNEEESDTSKHGVHRYTEFQLEGDVVI